MGEGTGETGGGEESASGRASAGTAGAAAGTDEAGILGARLGKDQSFIQQSFPKTSENMRASAKR